ncbi:MAG: ZIP family metal transporter [Candidatus Micrarchaeia archaeon]
MDLQIWMYAIGSAVLVSVLSLIGIFFLSISEKKLKSILIYLVSFSAGALLGDAFLHLLPEATEESGFTLAISFYVLLGVALSFIIEKFIRWRHCHVPTSHNHPHPVAIMNLVGDFVHNLIDGLIIGASYAASIPVGIATTMAVAFHEIPQEIGDFGVLIHGGLTKQRAIMLNFATALAAVLGTVIALVLTSYVSGLVNILVPLAAGGFIYIAGTDLIPEMHKETDTKSSGIQFGMLALGVAVMYLLKLMLEG